MKIENKQLDFMKKVRQEFHRKIEAQRKWRMGDAKCMLEESFMRAIILTDAEEREMEEEKLNDKIKDKSLKVMVTLTCERCGKEREGIQNWLDETEKIDRYGYFNVKKEPLRYYGGDYSNTYIGGEAIFLCPDCIKKYDIFLDKIAKAANKKIRGFLENKEE